MMDLVARVCGMPWYMHLPVAEAFASVIERHAAGVRLSADEIAAAIGRDADSKSPRNLEPERIGNIAVVPVRGVLAPYSSQVNGSSQPTGRSQESLQAELRDLAADTSVSAIVMRFDSPGGAVQGTQETADLIRQISAGGKPIYAYTDGLLASAAYFLASQADRIVSAPSGLIGSIGTVLVMQDTSEAEAKSGRKTIVLRSAPFKAVGQPGETIATESLANLRQVVMDLHQAFVANVAAGRGLSAEQAAAVATGEVWTPIRAVALDLVDTIQGWENFLAELTQSLKEGDPMSQKDKPAADAAPAAPDAPAGITKAVYARLAQAYPEHLDVLADLDAKAQPEAVIEKALLEARLATMTLRLDAQTKVAGEADAKIQALEAQLAKVSALGPGQTGATGPDGKPLGDVGGDFTRGGDGAPGEGEVRAAWERNPKIRDAYAVGGMAAFIRNCADGVDSPAKY